MKEKHPSIEIVCSTCKHFHSLPTCIQQGRLHGICKNMGTVDYDHCCPDWSSSKKEVAGLYWRWRNNYK